MAQGVQIFMKHQKMHGSMCSNIHATPEKRSRYASYEAVGFDPNLVDFKTFMKRLLSCFEPKQFSLATIQSLDRAAWGEEQGNNSASDRAFDSVDQKATNQ
ncbi:hypothetical protein Syun_025073 [Stephania yunnanensis]|uniref:Uncharacterized protein n=1 Tax=Stephania yunnanensis TaxID=152371 RepID=A0AAP0EWJ4_9MAGN